MNKMWKKAGINVSAVLLSTAVSLGSFMPAMAAETADHKDNDENARETDKETKAESKSKPVSKDETVYVKLNPDGSTKSITVSDWLKNLDGTASLVDQSDLSDIKNVKGTESFAAENDGSMVWTSDGSDIYYQGSTDKQLPVTMKITYFLDGKEVSAAELAGKSGKVKIRYDYANHSSQSVTINGKDETIATPFAVVTGMILPGEHFQNVEVTNGKVISDGSKMIVAGMAFPGMKDSLNLADSEIGKDINLPEYIEVTADATEFALDMSATIVTSSIFDELGIDDVDSMDDLWDALDDLSGAANELVDGSGELLNGVLKLQEASGEFTSGVTALANGADKLKSGSSELKNGVDSYTSGADTLNGGVHEYASGASALAEGTKQYVEGATELAAGIEQLAGQTAGLPDAVGQLYEGMLNVQIGAAKLADETTGGQLTKGSQAVADGIKSLHDSIVTLETALAQSNDQEALAATVTSLVQYMNSVLANDRSVLATLNDAATMVGVLTASKESLPENLKGTAQSLIDQYSGKLSDAIYALNVNIQTEEKIIESLQSFAGGSSSMDTLMAALKQMELATAKGEANSLYDGALAVSDGVNAMVAGSRELKNGVDQVTAGTARLASEAAALPDGIGQLTEGCETLTGNNEALLGGSKQILEASKTLTDGASALSSQSGALRNGVLSLYQGASTLADGTATLGSGTAQLTDGIDQLADGAKQLNDGMNEFNEDGIKQLTGTLEDEADGLLERLKAIVDAGMDYQTFTSLADGAKGSVKFIIETDSIKAE